MSPTADRQNALLDDLARHQAVRAQAMAESIRAQAELYELSDKEASASGVEQFLSKEIAGTTRRSRGSADQQVVDALRYVEALPLTVDALARGALYEHQARTMLDTTRNCTVEVARRVEERVLPDALELAPPDLKRKLTKAVLLVESELDSEAVTERLIKAREDRRVWAHPENDGMASVGALGAAEAVQQFLLDLDRLVQLEKAADRTAGVWRSADQIRSDVLLSLPGQMLERLKSEGVQVPTRPAKDSIVNVHVPVTTVLERGNEPGLLGGYGPISAEHVRLMRPDARFRRVFVDSRTGQPVGLDPELSPVAANAEEAMERIQAMLRPAVIAHVAEPQHDPSAELRRFVEIRDLRCRGVGCSLPANKCHQDHKEPYPAGPTAAGNLGPFSSSCHRAKHSGWTVIIGADGSTTWISPLGRRYRRPPAYDPPLLPTEPTNRPRKLPQAPTGEGSDDDEPLLLPPTPEAAEPPPPTVDGDDEPPF